METMIKIMVVFGFLLITNAAARKAIAGAYKMIFVKRSDQIFDYYIDCEKFYLYHFGIPPNTSYIDEVDIVRAYEHIRNNFNHLVVRTYQSNYFNRKLGAQEFTKTVLVLKNRMILELYCQDVTILFDEKGFALADSIINAMVPYKVAEKEEDYEINIITSTRKGLGLKQLEIKPTKLDIDANYNDDFIEVDKLIRKRLSRQNDKGIVLLHGLPGTGKTTYLRHLIGELKKKVLFVSPQAAANLMDPGFVDLLIDNPDSILVIEDAENIMMDRKLNKDSSVSNLLNLSDGLLSDCLSVQIICTFNSKLDLIDSALMRQGRLIARYEFGKLTIDKAQKFSKGLGFDTVIRQPMTIAEITNQNEIDSKPATQVIGFRRTEVQMN